MAYNLSGSWQGSVSAYMTEEMIEAVKRAAEEKAAAERAAAEQLEDDMQEGTEDLGAEEA